MAFGLFYGDFRKQMVSFALIGLFLYIIPHGTDLFVEYESNITWHLTGIFLAIPLLKMYNGQNGRSGRAFSLFFYLFYPLHLAVLYCVRQGIPEFAGMM